MTWNINEVINNISNGILGGAMMKHIIANPLYTSLLIVFVVILIVLINFRDSETSEPMHILCVRTGFWSFLFVTSILLLHNKILMADCKSANINGNYESLFDQYRVLDSNTTGNGEESNFVLSDAIVPVNINTNFNQS